MTLFDVPAPRPAALEDDYDDRLCPFCARCGLTAKAWSGVEEWMVAGQWIGWCSNECRRRWLKGEKVQVGAAAGSADSDTSGTAGAKDRVGDGAGTRSERGAESTGQTGSLPVPTSVEPDVLTSHYSQES